MPWERYAAWAEPDEGSVELSRIACAPAAERIAGAPSPYSLQVLRRLDADDVAAAAEAMEELRAEASELELRAQQRHEDEGEQAERLAQEQVLREIDEAAAAELKAAGGATRARDRAAGGRRAKGTGRGGSQGPAPPVSRPGRPQSWLATEREPCRRSRSRPLGPAADHRRTLAPLGNRLNVDPLRLRVPHARRPAGRLTLKSHKNVALIPCRPRGGSHVAGEAMGRVETLCRASPRRPGVA